MGGFAGRRDSIAFCRTVGEQKATVENDRYSPYIGTLVFQLAVHPID